MKRKLPQRVYQSKRPAKRTHEHTSTGAEVRPVLVAGPTKEGDQEWLRRLDELARKQIRLRIDS